MKKIRRTTVFTNRWNGAQSVRTSIVEVPDDYQLDRGWYRSDDRHISSSFGNGATEVFESWIDEED